jgi:hypothetical protein
MARLKFVVHERTRAFQAARAQTGATPAPSASFAAGEPVAPGVRRLPA